MPDITAAIDETAANVLVPRQIALTPVQSASGSGSIGPFTAAWSATATVGGGVVDIIPPPTDVIRVSNVVLSYTVGLTLSVSLSFLNFCLPRVCIPTPFGSLCTPRICVTFPTISVPVSHSSTITVAGDFRLAVALSGGNWLVDIVVVGIPSLVLGPAATLLLLAIGAAVSIALLTVPFIGPLLALASATIIGLIGFAGATGLLGPILTPFVSGLRFNVTSQPQMFELVPGAAPDPPVFVRIDNVAALLDGSGGEDELVLNIDISP